MATSLDTLMGELPQVPGYRAVSVVGTGSRACVYRARDLATQDIVALKVYAPTRAESPRDATSRLDAALARLGTVQGGDLVTPKAVIVAESPETVALAMEMVDGESLAHSMQRGVRFPPERAVRIASEIARTLGAAAAKGLHHGNLHCGKILIHGDATRVIGTGLDERLPEAFESPEISGRVSPHVYADNEALSGDAPDGASDVFSLGAILYHLLTGLPPYKATSLAALRVERADGPLVWPRGATDEFSAPLVKLVDRMTSYDRATRPEPGPMLSSALKGVLRRSRKTSVPVTRERPPEDMAAPASTPPKKAERTNPLTMDAIRRTLGTPAATWGLSLAAAAILLVAIALALRDPEPKTEEPAKEQTVATREKTGPALAAEPEPEVDPLPAPFEPDPTHAELDAIAKAFDENPADMEALKPRLDDLARKPGEAGVRATILLSKIRASQEDRADEALARLLDRAAALEASGRFGDALAAIEEFPKEAFDGTPAVKRSTLEADALKGRAAKTYTEIATRAEALVAKGDFKGARALYQSIRGSIGIPTWIERAERSMLVLGKREEEASSRARERKAAESARALHATVDPDLRAAARSCRSFKYTEAEKKLDELAAKPLSDADRTRVAAYAGLVEREAAQFRLIGKRIRDGKRQGFLNFVDSPRALIIRDVTENGLELSGLSTENGTLRSTFAWSRLPDYQAFKLMLEVGSSLTNLEERLALAVFCHHRGLASERENELRVAGGLARSLDGKELVKRIRETLATVEIDR